MQSGLEPILPFFDSLQKGARKQVRQNEPSIPVVPRLSTGQGCNQQKLMVMVETQCSLKTHSLTHPVTRSALGTPVWHGGTALPWHSMAPRGRGEVTPKSRPARVTPGLLPPVERARSTPGCARNNPHHKSLVKVQLGTCIFTINTIGHSVPHIPSYREIS